MRKLFFILLITPIVSYGQEVESEYADVIIEAYLHPKHTHESSFYGGFDNFYPIAVKPEVVLGHNRYFMSLPKGSYVVVGFTDNVITDFPGRDDIFIAEVGCSGEHAEVSVSSDGIIYTKLGIVDDCDISSLDLASINYTEAVKYIKIEGLDSRGGSPGFDLVSVMGLPGSNKAIYAPVDSIINYVDEPVIEKKFIIENIFFETNSSVLTDQSIPALDELVQHLANHHELSIKISGHTDNIGDDNFNLSLSSSRAESVVNYLVENGIDSNRLSFQGYGETLPLKSNDSEEGRQQNRRVEFEIIKN